MGLKPGDVVVLKSGGHPMTVAEVDDDDIACLWMGTEGELFRETLSLAVLEAAEIEDSLVFQVLSRKLRDEPRRLLELIIKVIPGKLLRIVP